MVVLCGSVTSMMYKETLEYSSPLYGRSTLQMLISPLSYHYLKEFFPKKSHKELVQLYSLTGGVPRYIELAQSHNDFQQALEELVLSRFGLLNNEAKYLLQEEIQTPNTYWSILHAIGSGSTKVSEISSRLGVPSSKISRYLELLRDLFMIERSVPVLETKPEKSKKGTYAFKDPFLRLWFGCVYPYQSLLELSDSKTVYKKILPQVETHITYVFEELCRHYVMNRIEKFGLSRVGRQWGKDYEIDVAGVNEDGLLALVGECKWSRSKVGLSVFNHLNKIVSEKQLPVAKELKYAFFSKSGFSVDLQKMALSNDKIMLVSDIFE